MLIEREDSLNWDWDGLEICDVDTVMQDAILAQNANDKFGGDIGILDGSTSFDEPSSAISLSESNPIISSVIKHQSSAMTFEKGIGAQWRNSSFDKNSKTNENTTINSKFIDEDDDWETAFDQEEALDVQKSPVSKESSDSLGNSFGSIILDAESDCFVNSFVIEQETLVLKAQLPSENSADEFALDGIPELPIDGLLSPPLSSTSMSHMKPKPRFSNTKNSVNKMYLASPVPSSTASIAASECDDEGFDDVMFPDFLDAKSFNLVQENKKKAAISEQKPSFLALSDLAENDVFNDEALEFPPDFQFKRNMSPSKIPRLANPVSFPALSSPVKNSLNPFASALLHSFPANSSFSVQQLLLASETWLSQRRTNETGVNLVRRPKTMQNYGDGKELDEFDDLPFKEESELRWTKTAVTRPGHKNRIPSAPAFSEYLTSQQVSSSQHSSHHASQNSSQYMPNTMKIKNERSVLSRSLGSNGRLRSGDENREIRFSHVNKLDNVSNRRVPLTNNFSGLKKKPKKKPTLIKNMNQPDTSKVIGEMVYNPALQKWEGNEVDMNVFDSQSKSVRPTLIAHRGGFKHIQTIGEMVFDPEKMCWVGNHDDDVFTDCMENECPSTIPFGRVIGSEFILSKQQSEYISISGANHKLFMGKWYPKAVTESKTMMRDTSKTHLYEIRTILS